MNSVIAGMSIRHDDELREARARIADLESLVAGLDRQVVILWEAIVALREGVYDVSEGKQPRLVGVGR